MGQYYTAVIENKKVGKVAYYTYGLKIIEHSWWQNHHMAFVSKLIYKTKSKVVWVGDYANEKGDWKRGQKKAYYNFAWCEENKSTESNVNLDEELYLDGKFLVNHTKKLCLNCSEYYKKNVSDGWCIHPLSLLTAKGNGRGGGDYYEDNPDYDSVGTWALDEISIEDEAPNDYEKVMYDFKEI